MENEVLRKVLAEKKKIAPETMGPEQEGFDLRTAGPLELQQVIGNKATSGLLKSGGSPIQAKLSVTAANDQYEQEADKVAEHVMSQPTTQRQPEDEELQAKRIQRQEEEDEMAMKRIQRVQSDDMMGAFDVGGGVEEQIRSAGSGEQIPDNVRGTMESGIGSDFSGVRVHNDANADALSRSLSARAFTHGSDVFFRSGEYSPGSSDGQKLLAHELTHVVQQGGAQRKHEDD